MASPTALREWCRAACARYPDVDIRDLSHSFRDGLAFCAIIHKHRPDLIDFRSLSKDNAYLNNKLAFEVAEAELGIPALLDPSDVAGKEPDYLAVVTYLSWHYCFFNRKSYAGPASSGSRRANVSGDLAKSGPPGGTKHLQRPADTEGEGGEGDRCSGGSPRTACALCFKPVHLIQRRLAEGKVYHRSCFRCAVCRGTLLPGSYTQGSDAGTLVCGHHAAVGSDHPSQQENRPAGDRTQCRVQEVSSLSGLVISSAPHYSRRAVSGTAGMEATQMKVKSVKKAAPPPPPPARQPDVPDQAAGEAGPNRTPAGAASRPVPTPRRRSSITAAPVPAPRTRTSQPASRAPAAGSSPSQSQSSPTQSHVSVKYKANHPWMNIVSPGPWQHLPPTQAPLPAPRTWYRSRAPPSNPFEKSESASGADSGATSRSGSEGGGSAAETVGASAQDVSDSNESDAVAAAAAAAAADVAPSENQSDSLPRSLSVPALASGNVSSAASKKEGDQAATRQTKTACKVNPFDEKPSFPKSKTFQTFPSRRAPAPGHGFPLIKRKVQTDPCISTESFLVEMSDLDRRLEELERQGVELERNLRGCKDDKEEERLLLEWFGLHHARHQLVRRDAELCHLTMQQRLEEKQADVEYELRCLLNKQECDWTQEDRDKEQQLLNELVSIIDQRNLIISSLDQDMQRERGEDKLLEATLESKDLQTERLKELRKSKAKFSPTKVFKKLNHKAAGGKDPAGDKR